MKLLIVFEKKKYDQFEISNTCCEISSQSYGVIFDPGVDEQMRQVDNADVCFSSLSN